MTLDRLTDDFKGWTQEKLTQCWTDYYPKYVKKHGTALFYAINNGDITPYVKREAETFRRYARMWRYKDEK